MNTTTLNNFLIEDVKDLLEFINSNEDAQDIETPGAHFETLGVFASYWNHHINELSK